MERRRVFYSGRVQGVGFRAGTRAIAAGFAVTGSVRNETDGRVRVEAQGVADEVGGFLSAVRDRMGAHIRGETTDRAALIDGESGFVIAR